MAQRSDGGQNGMEFFTNARSKLRSTAGHLTLADSTDAIHCDLSRDFPNRRNTDEQCHLPEFFDPAAGNIVVRQFQQQTRRQVLAKPDGGRDSNPLTPTIFGKIDHQLGAITAECQLLYTAAKKHIRAGTGARLPWALQEFNWRQHNANVSDTLDHQSDESDQLWVGLYAYFGGRLNISNPALGLPADASLANFGSRSPYKNSITPQHCGDDFFNRPMRLRAGQRKQFRHCARYFNYTRGHHSLKSWRGDAAKGHSGYALEQLRNVYLQCTATANSAANPKSLATHCGFLLGIPSASHRTRIRALP